jgi:hypothetical protein
MLANIKFSKPALLVAYLIVAASVAFFLSTASASAQAINIAQSLCAGANLDYSAINNSGACGSGQIEASTLQLNNFVTSIISLLSWAIGVVAVFMIIVGGFKYITSGGDSAGVTAAKNTILYAIIGLVIVALSQLIVRFILGRLTTVGLG